MSALRRRATMQLCPLTCVASLHVLSAQRGPVVLLHRIILRAQDLFDPSCPAVAESCVRWLARSRITVKV